MNPGGSRTARLWPAPGRNHHLKQEGNPKKQQTYPQTTSYTATTEGGSILDANSGSVLNANQQKSSADFADCLVERSADAMGCGFTATFDKRAAKIGSMKLL